MKEPKEMISFSVANKARTSLKMTLSKYAWFKSSFVEVDGDSFCILICISYLDESVDRVIPSYINDVPIKLEIVKK